jgi:hypothetical protein
MRYTPGRHVPMLQWNSKYTALVTLAVLVAISALAGFSSFGELFTNFTW